MKTVTITRELDDYEYDMVTREAEQCGLSVEEYLSWLANRKDLPPRRTPFPSETPGPYVTKG